MMIFYSFLILVDLGFVSVAAFVLPRIEKLKFEHAPKTCLLFSPPDEK
jgi:hypothetical protein